MRGSINADLFTDISDLDFTSIIPVPGKYEVR